LLTIATEISCGARVRKGGIDAPGDKVGAIGVKIGARRGNTMKPRTVSAMGALVAAVMAFTAPAQAETISFADAMSVMARDCGADVQKHCKGVPLANNGVGQCLVANQAQVSPVCIQTLAAVRASLAARIEAQDNVIKVCRGDANRRCQGVVNSDAHTLDCLLKAANHVSKKCNAAITNAGWR
jgi:hypothetical protein